MAAFKVLLKSGWGVQVDAAAAGHPHHQKVLLIGHAAFLVIDNLAVAIEREAVLDVPADAEDGYGLICRAHGVQAIGNGTSGVGAVQQVNDTLRGADLGDAKEWAYTIEEQDQHREHHRG